jgi:3,4-dihydroxy 2-butanone 4-phosphate synthase/GTP cyclohydrolase II
MVTDFIERVRAALKQHGVTARGVAHKAGLHRNTLCNIDRPDWNPTADVLKKLEPHIAAIERGEWQEPPADEPEQAAAA